MNSIISLIKQIEQYLILITVLTKDSLNMSSHLQKIALKVIKVLKSFQSFPIHQNKTLSSKTQQKRIITLLSNKTHLQHLLNVLSIYQRLTFRCKLE
jgi:hypothetical protein